MSEAHIWGKVEHAARKATDDTGRFNQKEFQEEIDRELSDDELTPAEQQITREMLVKNLATRFIRKRAPKRSNQGTLFNIAAVLPLGDGKRIWMGESGPPDWLMWGAQSTKNVRRVLKAEAERQEYIGSRLEAARDHPEWKLHQIETDIFAYEDEPWEDAPTDLDDEDE